MPLAPVADLEVSVDVRVVADRAALVVAEARGEVRFDASFARFSSRSRRSLSACVSPALAELVEEGVPPSVNFALWRPNSDRLAKAQILRGSVLGARGELVPIETVGPCNIRVWDRSWAVYQTAHIMIGAVDLPPLERHKRKIHSLLDQYGADN